MTDQIAEGAPPVARSRQASIKKFAWLGGLAIATLIPTELTSDLIDERQTRQVEAKAMIAKSWGPEQTVLGPTIMIPIRTGDGKTSYFSIAPKTLDAAVTLVADQRHRGFFTANVYTATINLKGTFAIPDSISIKDATTVSMPDRGFLAVTLTRPAGVESTDRTVFAATRAPWQIFTDASAESCATDDRVLVVPIDLTKSRDNLPFEAVLHLRGTQTFQFGALAKTSKVNIKSAWPTPSFIGDESPMTTNLSPGGFDAQWRGGGIGEAPLVRSACPLTRFVSVSMIGVDLIDTVPIYRMVTRAAKYGPLFVVLAFTIYFVFEMLAGIAITIVQYGLTAASLSLFALLLVSISEFTGYTAGYLVSAALVIAQASIFTASVMQRLRPAIAFATLLSALFGFVYVLLGLESLALLTGSVALFLMLSVVMVVTQRVHRIDRKAA